METRMITEIEENRSERLRKIEQRIEKAGFWGASSLHLTSKVCVLLSTQMWHWWLPHDRLFLIETDVVQKWNSEDAVNSADLELVTGMMYLC